MDFFRKAGKIIRENWMRPVEFLIWPIIILFILLNFGLAKLIELLNWPVVVLVIVIYFGPALRKFLEKVAQANVKLPGVEVTLSSTQIEIATNLGAAAASQADGQPPHESQVAEIANVVKQEITPQTIRNVSGASVLWVDDQPSQNNYKRKAMELLGIRFTISTTTDDALEKLSHHKYDVIISDMTRPLEGSVVFNPSSWSSVSSPPDWGGVSSPPNYWAGTLLDEQAAYTLLEELRKRNIDTPLIIHSTSSVEKKAEARRRGVFGFTGNPETLLRMVIDAITSRQPA